MVSYVVASILAVILGQVANHIVRHIPSIIEDEKAYKKFFGLFNFKNYDFKIDYIYSAINLLAFNCINAIYYDIFSYTYMVAFFALTIVFTIDMKMQLIPDTCHIVIALSGIVNLLINFNNISNYIHGFLIGGISFYLISLFSKLVFKKEGMGFGDVKLMASLGLLAGSTAILAIGLLSFILSAVISLILIVFSKKNMTSYIPFGPFIVIAAVIVMLTGSNFFIEAYLSFCTFLGDKILDVVYKLMN